MFDNLHDSWHESECSDTISEVFSHYDSIPNKVILIRYNTEKIRLGSDLAGQHRLGRLRLLSAPQADVTAGDGASSDSEL